jgi:hypothetical protein
LRVEIEFPDEAGEKLRELIRLHPGKTLETVFIRALTFYHACYDLMLLGHLSCSCITEVMEHLDEQDEKEGR